MHKPARCVDSLLETAPDPHESVVQTVGYEVTMVSRRNFLGSVIG